MRLAGLLILAAALAGCADRQEAVTGPGTTNLKVLVSPMGTGAGPTHTHSVTCPGSAACGRLRAADLAAVPAGRACTKIYGGPAEATVRGSLEGRGVNARFSLSSGCEIDRWRQAAYLLGDPPGQ